MRDTAGRIVAALRVIDVVVLACLLATFTNWQRAASDTATVIVLLLTLPLTYVLLSLAHVYDSHRLEEAREIARKLLQAHVAAAAIVVPLLWGIGGDRVVARQLLDVFAVSFAVLTAAKYVVYLTLRRLRRRGFDHRNVLFVGSWEEAAGADQQLRAHPEWGLQIACVATGEPGNRGFYTFETRQQIVGDVEDVLRGQVIDEVLMPVGRTPVRSAFKEASLFEQYGLLVRLVFAPVDGAPVNARLEEFAGGTSLAVPSSTRDESAFAMKRVFDVAIALLLLAIAAPVIAAAAVMIKLTSPGPVFFKQVRVGLNGRRFHMIKLRTMVHGAEYLVRQASNSITRGPIFKDPRDYRITFVGHLLRKFSLDELPQLWNVLRGEMSIVGPRPLPVYEADQISGEYRRRFSMPPGLTCFWQVSGRSDVTFDSWMKYDLQYVDGWSLWTDTKLLLRTIPAVLTGRGSY